MWKIIKSFKAQIMDEAAMNRCIMRISHEITEKNKGVTDLCIIGIKSRGVFLAQKICSNIKAIEGVDVPCGTLNIHSYRDDLDKTHSGYIKTQKPSLPFDVFEKNVIIVDDVLFTGRTVRAAIEAVFSLGRPKTIQLAILIDRGHRELPFKADYTGKNIPTSHSERVMVCLPECDNDCGVFICEPEK